LENLELRDGDAEGEDAGITGTRRLRRGESRGQEDAEKEGREDAWALMGVVELAYCIQAPPLIDFNNWQNFQ